MVNGYSFCDPLTRSLTPKNQDKEGSRHWMGNHKNQKGEENKRERKEPEGWRVKFEVQNEGGEPEIERFIQMESFFSFSLYRKGEVRESESWLGTKNGEKE